LRTIKYPLMLVTTLFAISANAEILLKDNTEILGKWKVYAEAAALDKEKSDLNVEWEFKADGVLNTLSKDTRGRTGSFDIPLKYSIVDGAIKKQSTPGREKYETCIVVEKTGSEMIIKCKFLYYFMKKGS